MNDPSLRLMDAVADHSIEGVRECLAAGANPNFRRPQDPNDENRPNTPLRMVVFRISDALLNDEELRGFVDIARELVQAGADRLSAMDLAERRYGRYDPNNANSPFQLVWNVVAGV